MPGLMTRPFDATIRIAVPAYSFDQDYMFEARVFKREVSNADWLAWRRENAAEVDGSTLDADFDDFGFGSLTF